MHIAPAAIFGILTIRAIFFGGCAAPQSISWLETARADFATKTRPAKLMVAIGSDFTAYSGFLPK
jgi:hypothetical protein